MTISFTAQFGLNISEARKSLGVTQKEVAALLDVKQGEISKIEKGGYFSVRMLKYLVFLHDRGIDLNKIFSLKLEEEPTEKAEG